MSWLDGEAPDGWTLSQLGNIARILGGGTPKTSVPGNLDEQNGHPWITPADLTDYTEKYVTRGRRLITDQGLSTSSARVVPIGTVLFSSRAPIGYVAIAANPLATNQGFRSLVPSDSINSDYLYYVMQFLRPLAEQRASGTTFPEISGTSLGQLPIAFPGLPEQRAIAHTLDMAVDWTRAIGSHLTAAGHAIEKFRQSVLTAATAGRLTAAWRSANPATEATSKLVTSGEEDALPVGWTRATVDELAEPGAAVSYGIVKPGPEVPGGVPYVRQQDIIDGTVLVDQLAHTSAELAAKHRRTALQAGDVLLCIIRNLRVAIVPPGIDGANITQGMVRIRPGNRVLGEYLAYYLSAPSTQQRMHAQYVGLAMPRINVRDARELSVDVPPLDEQREIVNRVRQLFLLADELQQHIDTASRRVDLTMQAVLGKAFRGELVASA